MNPFKGMGEEEFQEGGKGRSWRLLELPNISYPSAMADLTHPHTHPLTHKPTRTHPHTHPITHSLTHPLTHSPTHPLTHTSTQHTHTHTHNQNRSAKERNSYFRTDALEHRGCRQQLAVHEQNGVKLSPDKHIHTGGRNQNSRSPQSAIGALGPLQLGFTRLIPVHQRAPWCDISLT